MAGGLALAGLGPVYLRLTGGGLMLAVAVVVFFLIPKGTEVSKTAH